MRNMLGYIVCLILFPFSHTIYGHHAFTAEFDANAPINITGKVVKVEWINPHAWVHVEVQEESNNIDDKRANINKNQADSMGVTRETLRINQHQLASSEIQ